MIKYVIKTGSKFLNDQARGERDIYYKPKLKGMTCRKCKNDTIIRFVEDDLTHIKSDLKTCCEYFENRIRERLWSNKN